MEMSTTNILEQFLEAQAPRIAELTLTSVEYAFSDSAIARSGEAGLEADCYTLAQLTRTACRAVIRAHTDVDTDTLVRSIVSAVLHGVQAV
jgi:hypothetical protein